MGNFADQRIFRAEPEWVFAAVNRAVHSLGWNIKSTDGHGEVAFTTPVSGFSWGANMLASVNKSPEGGLVRVSGATRVRRNFLANPEERTNVVRLLDAVGYQVQAMLQQDPSGGRASAES